MERNYTSSGGTKCDLVLEGENISTEIEIETKSFKKGMEISLMIFLHLIAIQCENVLYKPKTDCI